MCANDVQKALEDFSVQRVLFFKTTVVKFNETQTSSMRAIHKNLSTMRSRAFRTHRASQKSTIASPGTVSDTS